MRQPGRPLSLVKVPACGTELCSLPPPQPFQPGTASQRLWRTHPAPGPSVSAQGLSASALQWDGDSDRVSDCPLATILPLNPILAAIGAVFGLFSG